jgi:outer membrane receptor protein involved in Fe transport
VREIDPNNPNDTILTFDGGQKSRGVELDMNWRATDRLTLMGSYSHTHSRATNRGVDVDVMSRQFLRIPYHQAGATLNYQVSAPLRLYVNMRYSSNAFVDTGGGITNPTTRLVDSNNGQRLIQSPDYAVWNVGAAYKFKTGQRLNHTVNVTAKNVFDKEYIQPNRYVGDRFGVYVSYALKH